MKLEAIKNAVTSKVGRQMLIGHKHSPTILFAAGVTGVVATTVLACKATLKLEDILDETQDLRYRANSLQHKEYSEADRIKDHRIITVQAAVKVAKLYAPAVAVGVISVAALTRSHVVLSQRNAAALAAYSALDKGFKEYRARVREELGEDKDREFRYGYETVTETVEDRDGKPKTVEHRVAERGMPSIYARWFDDASTSWSKLPGYNHVFLMSQQNYINDRLKVKGHVFLNEVYDMLNLPRCREGQVVGWLKDGDGDGFIDFGIFDNDDRVRRFMNGDEYGILLDFNVDGPILDLI